jgi:hypothetical protein
MSILFLDDRRLYSDFSYYRSNFEWENNDENDNLLTYHCYWAGLLTDHHRLSIKSLMITQSPPFEVWVWLPPGEFIRNSGFISSFNGIPGIKFKSYMPEIEARGTVFEPGLEIVRGKKPPAVSDLFRLLILWNYGGIYFDLDVLFLKDFRKLCHVEFFYQWSNQPYGNHAVSCFSRRSPNIRSMAERCIRIKSFHPARLLLFSEISELLENVYVFPTFLFDPVWIAHDTKAPANSYCNQFDDFFANELSMKLKDFFPGSFSYHWHNRWNAPIRPCTIVGEIYSDVSEMYRAKFG